MKKSTVALIAAIAVSVAAYAIGLLFWGWLVGTAFHLSTMQAVVSAMLVLEVKSGLDGIKTAVKK